MALVDERGELRIRFASALGQRMIRRQRHEARAEQRVRPRGEDLDLVTLRRRLDQARSGRSRPSERPIQFFCISRTFSGQRSSVSSAVEQLVGIFGDLEEPLRQLALLHRRAGAPAAAVDHLLVGEHGLSTGSQFTLRFLR